MTSRAGVGAVVDAEGKGARESFAVFALGVTPKVENRTVAGSVFAGSFAVNADTGGSAGRRRVEGEFVAKAEI